MGIVGEGRLQYLRSESINLPNVQYMYAGNLVQTHHIPLTLKKEKGQRFLYLNKVNHSQSWVFVTVI